MAHTHRVVPGNSRVGAGVYLNMHRGILVLLCSVAAMAQPQQLSPLDSAIQAFHKARSEGRFEEAAAKREEARTLLAQTPVESERFAGQVQGVSQLYQSV